MTNYDDDQEESSSSRYRYRHDDTLSPWLPDLNVHTHISNFDNSTENTSMTGPNTPYVFETNNDPDQFHPQSSITSQSQSIKEIAGQVRSSCASQPLDEFLPHWSDQDTKGRLVFPIKPLLRGTLFDSTSQTLNTRIALAWIKSAREEYTDTVKGSYHTTIQARRGNPSEWKTRAVGGDSLKPAITRSLSVSAGTMINNNNDTGILKSATPDSLLGNDDGVRDTLYQGANTLMDALVDNPFYNLQAGDAKVVNGLNQGMPKMVPEN